MCPDHTRSPPTLCCRPVMAFLSLFCGHHKLLAAVMGLPIPTWGSFIRGNVRLSSEIPYSVESAPPGSPPPGCWMKALPGKSLTPKNVENRRSAALEESRSRYLPSLLYQVLEDVIRDMYISNPECMYLAPSSFTRNRGRSLPRGSGEVGQGQGRSECDTQNLGGRNGTPAPGFLRLRVAEIRRVMKPGADSPFPDAASLW